MMKDQISYDQKVKEHCARYAKVEDTGEGMQESDDSEEENEDSNEEYSSEDELEVEGVIDYKIVTIMGMNSVNY
ncbi:hypothetical protein QJS10_CPA05g01171 [Acorus calamus]|uniref:Uncharacterized protein n=1 Tax=Acorus calamus TaxID=4465 RepID=A0AAV9ETW6_ACOCL|nr:hypothetical protein QJS10_CPA05g01171 [Acorus calamus]